MVSSRWVWLLCLMWNFYESHERPEREWRDLCTGYFSFFHSADKLYFKPTMSTATPDLPTNEHTRVFFGSYCAADLSHALEATYSEIVHWRINSFKVPASKAAKEFVYELSRLFLIFASASSMVSIALRAVIVLPILLFQKPHRIKSEGTFRLS